MEKRRGFIPLDEKGFTLLELLMVVIIIAILAAIALPQYLRVAERSRSSEALQNLSVIRSAESRLKAEKGDYNNDLSKLDVDVPKYDETHYGTTDWAFTVDGTDAVATRRNDGKKVIKQHMATSTQCSDDAQYGLAAC